MYFWYLSAIYVKMRILPCYVKIRTSAHKNNHEQKKIEKNKNGVWNKTMTMEWLSVYTQHHFHSTYHLYYFYSLLRCHVTLSAKTSKSFIYDKLLRFIFPTLRSRGVFIWNSTVSKRKRTLFVWVFPGVLFWIIRVWIFFFKV